MIERSTIEHGRTLVTFRLPKTVLDDEPGEDEVMASVVGDFNEWTPGADPLEPEGDDLVAHVELDWGQKYRFRYLLAAGHWENDHHADGYEPNDHGGDDSILDLT
jgi:hypothetical protein